MPALEELIWISREPKFPAEISFSSDSSRKTSSRFTGKTLAEVAKMRRKDPVETIMDLISEDESRIDTIYFVIAEENVKKQMAKQWISFSSDEAS